MSERKILTLDIETSPHLGYFFSMKNTYITPVQIIEPTRMISFAAKWAGKPAVMFESEYEGFKGHSHERMVRKAHELLNEADVVVHYNGDNFDLRHMGREFRKYGLGDPSPSASVDLWKVVKKKEDWASHKLAYITEQYHLSGKMENSGWILWLGVLGVFGEEARRKFWYQMRRYNKQDVRTTEELFFEARDLITNLPHVSLYNDDEIDPDNPVCGICEGLLHRRGHAYTKTRRYPRYHCPACNKWHKGTRSDRSVGTTT